MSALSFRAAVRTAAAAADDKKARNIQIHDAKGSSSAADYFLLATVESPPQMAAVEEEIDRRVKDEHGLNPVRREGRSSDLWHVLDYGGFVVHVMTEKARQFYGLERLWEHTRSLSVSKEPALPPSPSSAGPAGRSRKKGAAPRGARTRRRSPPST